jgi:hypothetical protein
MRKIIFKMFLMVSVTTLTSCTATDELPGHVPDSSQKRVKKSPVIYTEPAGIELAV